MESRGRPQGAGPRSPLGLGWDPALPPTPACGQDRTPAALGHQARPEAGDSWPPLPADSAAERHTASHRVTRGALTLAKSQCLQGDEGWAARHLSTSLFRGAPRTHLGDPRDVQAGSRGSWAIGSQPAIPRAVGQGPSCESPTRPVPPTADTLAMPEAASGAREHRAHVALAPTLRTRSLVTCSTRLLSQQPPRGPPGMGGCAESLSRGILPSGVLQGECGLVAWAGLWQPQPLELHQGRSAVWRQARGPGCTRLPSALSPFLCLAPGLQGPPSTGPF